MVMVFWDGDMDLVLASTYVSTVTTSTRKVESTTRIAENFGKGKCWQIWQFAMNSSNSNHHVWFH